MNNIIKFLIISTASISSAIATDYSAENVLEKTPLIATEKLTISQVKIIGNTLFNENLLIQKIDPSIFQEPQSFGELSVAITGITNFYKDEGYPLVRAILLPQRIDNGIVTIRVIEGSLSTVSVDNQSRVNDATANAYLHSAGVSQGKALNQPQAERAMLLTQDLAGTGKVTYQLAAAEQAGGTAMTVNVADAPLVDGMVSVDNYGSDSTGEVRTRANINLNSPLGYGERFSVNAMSSFKGIHNGSLSAELPVGSQGTKLSADISHTRYDLGGDFKDLDATGTSTTLNVGASQPLIRSNKKNLWLSGGVRYSDLQDNIGSTNTTTDKTLKAVQFGINGNLYDNLGAGGYTQYGINNTLGNLSIDSADAKAIDAASEKTDGNFYKLSANISRTQYLNPQWSLFGAVSGQLSNKNLDSSEQLSVGGVGGVAAYHANDVSADQGLIGQLELRYRVNDNLTLAGFYQAAAFKLRHNPYTTVDNTSSVQGAGLGLYGNYKGFNIESKVAWRIGDKVFSNDKKPRFWLRAGYGF